MLWKPSPELRDSCFINYPSVQWKQFHCSPTKPRFALSFCVPSVTYPASFLRISSTTLSSGLFSGLVVYTINGLLKFTELEEIPSNHGLSITQPRERCCLLQCPYSVSPSPVGLSPGMFVYAIRRKEDKRKQDKLFRSW